MAKSSRKTADKKAIRRAIRKADPTREPPTVGKPVIIDPADEEKASRRQTKRSQNRAAD